VSELRKQIIDAILSTQGQSEGVTADAIMYLLQQSQWHSAAERLPDEQCAWWWWNGDPDGQPILVSILYSGTSCKYFAAIGQYGWNVAQYVEDMGGYWMKAVIPQPPVESGL
jgi:hypothetical protein